MITTLRHTRLGDLVIIKGILYVVNAYRSSTHVQVTPIHGTQRARLFPIDKICTYHQKEV